MAYLPFLDESGHDLKDSPYEVLAGVAVEDRDLWNLICAVQQSEETHFGQRYADEERELKAKRLLKRKVFRHAAQAATRLTATRGRHRTRVLDFSSKPADNERGGFAGPARIAFSFGRRRRFHRDTASA
ncbi:MAG TPA: DUF3800 domain-containing protein [Solirubrobacteraceae bacterium]|nr:DUF3800 domain-containing protein [Solirubrobacteraceae bacterium]